MTSIESTFGIGRLIAKHLTNALDAEEQNQLDAWLKEDQNHVEVFDRIVAHESLAAALIEMEQVNTELALANVKSRISELDECKPVRLWPRVAAVAAAVAMVVFGVWFFNYQDAPEGSSGQVLDDKGVVVNDVAPGKNGATITLASGKVIQLSDAKTGVVIGDDKLAYNDGSPLSPQGGSLPEGESSAGAKEMTASTTKGQTYIFTLPDGTKVWLNAASTLTIPSDFSGTESRKVELTGEAYFEVAKNKKRPFIVESNGQEVTVLGTHFNINAYKDEGAIKTTLLEGSVRVSGRGPSELGMTSGQRGGKTPNSSLSRSDISPQGGERSIVLKPNQQSVVSGSNRIAVKEIDPEEAVAWKDGKFVFNREDIKTIMRKIERWYDVQVVYKDNVGDLPFSGTISRRANVSMLLNVLQKTGMLQYKIEGRKIILSK